MTLWKSHQTFQKEEKITGWREGIRKWSKGGEKRGKLGKASTKSGDFGNRLLHTLLGEKLRNYTNKLRVNFFSELQWVAFGCNDLKPGTT